MVSCFVEKLRLPLAGQEEIEQKNQKREKRGEEDKYCVLKNTVESIDITLY